MAKDINKALAIMVVGFLALGGIMLYDGGFLGSTTYSTTGGGSGGGQAPAAGGQTQINVMSSLAAVTLTAVEATTGATPNLNAELTNDAGKADIGETNIATAAASFSTAAPNSYNGYFMVGNDAGVSTTDRGAEVYYKKVNAQWTNTLKPSIDLIKVYNETTVTWSGFDQGTLEATTNISVGATNENTNLRLKMEVTGTGALGNPDFDHPLAVCFNSTTYGSFDYIRPRSYFGTFSVPKNLISRNIVAGTCYILNTQALTSTIVSDAGGSSNPFYEFDVSIKPSAGFNPGDAELAYAFPLDKTYLQDDSNNWNYDGGWGYNSQLGTSTDIGFAWSGNEKLIGMT